MKTYKQKTDFLHIGNELITWYKEHGRCLPWRESIHPYNIWISEIVLQQTQVKQGLQHYINFVERFPNVQILSDAEEDEVLKYWKGLGYYSRAINLHKASHQIVDDYNGEFPNTYKEILKLKGIGKYTASAIASICFDEKMPAIDGNFYRVLSRLFADDFDISNSKAFNYFSELALLIMPDKEAGYFNQAIMDLGSEICKPKNPICGDCPVNKSCLAFSTGTMLDFPVKTKKVKVEELALSYYFVQYKDRFLIKRRGDDFIWKKLYEFPTVVPAVLEKFIMAEEVVSHKLTHKSLKIAISTVVIEDENIFQTFARQFDFMMVDILEAEEKSFPKPLELFYHRKMKPKNKL